MLSVTYPDLSLLTRHVLKHDFFIVGELHGIEQNAQIVRALLDEAMAQVPCVSIAFEWSLTNAELKTLRAFIAGDIDSMEIPSFFHDSDGRVTKSHIELIRHMRAVNQKESGRVRIYTFDTPGRISEQAMADNVACIRAESDTAPLIVETGTVHAERRKGSLTGVLAEWYRVYTAFVEYESGEVMVEGELHQVRDSASQRKGPGDMFDAVIKVKCAKATTDDLPKMICGVKGGLL